MLITPVIDRVMNNLIFFNSMSNVDGSLAARFLFKPCLGRWLECPLQASACFLPLASLAITMAVRFVHILHGSAGCSDGDGEMRHHWIHVVYLLHGFTD